MSITIQSGGLIRMDSADETRLQITWDDHFASGVKLADVGIFTVEAIRPVEVTPTLVVTAPSFPDPEQRAVDFTLSGGTSGTKYRVAHLVITNETAPQTRERSFYVHIAEL